MNATELLHRAHDRSDGPQTLQDIQYRALTLLRRVVYETDCDSEIVCDSEFIASEIAALIDSLDEPRAS